ncbi:AAA family ATPase [Actinomycetospora sp. C-140]
MDLVGREDETRAVHEVVDGASSGPRTLLLLGEAGSGKTTLLHAAAVRAGTRDMTVVAGAGCAAEAEQSFAVLDQLLAPLLPQLSVLPASTARAVRAAVGLVADQQPVDAAAVRTGVLRLLGAVATQRPLLLVVDDVQLVDRDTCEVLTFVLRRLTTERIAVVIAARSTVRPAGIEAGVPAISLGPLPDVDAARLLDSLPDAPTGRARLDVLAEAGGNPLALVELASVVAREGGLARAGLAAPARLQDMFSDRLARLPEATRRLLVYAAAAAQEDLATTVAAAGTGEDLSGWAPAEEAGLVVVGRDSVAFRHPLVRAATYEGAPAGLRSRAHRDLAAALVHDPARRAWHLAEATIAPDEAVAAALEETATLARQRGGVHATARALQRAAERTPDTHERARRYTLALAAADDYGDPAWIRELHQELLRLTDDPDLLGAAAAAAGHGLSLSGLQREAFSLLEDSLTRRRPRQASTTVTLTGVLSAVHVQSGLPEHGRRVAALLARAPTAPAVEASGLLPPAAHPAMMESIRAQLHPDPDAHRILDDPGAAVHRPLDGPADVARLLCLGSTAWFADAPDLALDAFRRARSALGAEGALGMVVMCLPAMASAMIDTGRWGDATTLLDEIGELAVVHHHRYAEADVAALRTELAARRGLPGAEVDPAAWTAVDLDENRATHARLLRAAGLAAAAAGDRDAAFRHLQSLFAPRDEPRHFFLSARSIADLADAARAVGAQDVAAPIVAAVRARVGERPTTRLRLLLHRAEALLADEDTPDTAVERSHRLAVIDPAGEQWPLERALARLQYAQWLRRRRRPLEARPLLGAAHDTFVRLGAAGLAGLARGELRASGGADRASSPPTDPLAALTSQQREIVILAARGLRNREIAEQLYLSPRTVGSHLHNAYPKLGVSGRHQLREFLGELPET